MLAGNSPKGASKLESSIPGSEHISSDNEDVVHGFPSKHALLPCTGKKTVSDIRSWGTKIVLIFVAVLWLIAARECKKLLGASRAYMDSTLGVQSRRLASGGDEENSDGEGRALPSPEDDTYTVCAIITNPFRASEEEETPLLDDTSRTATREGSLAYEGEVYPQREQASSGSSSQQRSSVLRLKVPGTRGHGIPRRVVTPYYRPPAITSERRRTSFPPQRTERHVGDDRYSPPSFPSSLLADVRVALEDTSGDISGSASTFPGQPSVSPQAPIYISDDEKPSTSRAASEELLAQKQSQMQLPETSGISSPSRSITAASGRSSKSSETVAASRQSSVYDSQETTTAPSSKIKKPRRSKAPKAAHWRATSVSNIPMVDPEVAGAMPPWDVDVGRIGQCMWPNVAKRIASRLFYILSKRTVDSVDAEETQLLSLRLLENIPPLSIPASHEGGRVEGAMYGLRLMCTNVLYRASTMLPNSQRARWWDKMFDKLNLSANILPQRTNVAHRLFVERCMAALQAYRTGGQPDVTEIRELLEWYQSTYSKSAAPRQESEEDSSEDRQQERSQ